MREAFLIKLRWATSLSLTIYLVSFSIEKRDLLFVTSRPTVIFSHQTNDLDKHQRSYFISYKLITAYTKHKNNDAIGKNVTWYFRIVHQTRYYFIKHFLWLEMFQNSYRLTKLNWLLFYQMGCFDQNALLYNSSV